jgi:sortase A
VEAKRYRAQSREGEAIGRIKIPRMHLNMIVVDGTDHDTLKKGPGRDLRTFMPGENRLVYIAGHRTTYLAPFSHIDQLRKGDKVTLEVPYATFVYAITGHRVVPADDLSVLRSPRHELLELQACHPRFFATHRYIAYALLARVEPRGGTPYDLAAAAQTSGK